MNSLERYLATIDGKPVDHIARLPILMQFAAEHIGSYYGAFASDYRVLTEANIVCAREFGIDQMNTMSDPYRETQGYAKRGLSTILDKIGWLRIESADAAPIKN